MRFQFIDIDRARIPAILALAITLAGAPGARATDYTFTWGHPRPQGNPLGGLAFEDASTGYAVGARGSVVRTTDGGVTWQLISSYPQLSVDLEDVLVLGPGELLAVGEQPGIFRSTDGGESWSPVSNPSTAPLRDLDAITPLVFSAVGDNGQVLRSTDAGDTWSLLASPGGALHGQVWLDPSNGYAMGNMLVRRTTDGGMSWAPLNGVPDTDSFNSGFFTDAQHGYIFSDFTNWSTTDGGASWTGVVPPPFMNYTEDAIVLGPQHFLVATRTEGARIHESTDGGGTWEMRFDPGETGFLDFERTATGALIVVGTEGDIFRSTDLGATWTNQIASAPPPRQTIGGLNVGPGGRGVAGTSGSPGNHWYVTTDAGATWNLDPGGPNIPFTSDIAYWDADHAIAAGDYQKFWRSIDGGLTWSDVVPPNAPSNGQSWHVSLPAAGIGYAVMTGQSQAVVYRTTDFGATWQLRNTGLPTSGGLTAIGFPTANVGYVAGYTPLGQARMYKTTDGGAGWTLMSPTGLPTSWVWDMQWHDVNVGLATVYTQPGGIFRTTDGGATWANVEATPVRELSFSDALHGVASLAAFPLDGRIFVTEDGGVTWQTQEVPAKEGGSAVAATPEGFLVGGSYGTIVKATRVNPADVDANDAPGLAASGGAVLRARPAGSRVDVEFTLPAGGAADLCVIDVAGRRVASVTDGTFAGQTLYRTSWNGNDDRGGRAPSGVYFVRLRYGSRATAVRVVMPR